MTDIIILFCCSLCGFLIGKVFSRQLVDKENFVVDVACYCSAVKQNVTGKQLEIAQLNAVFAQNCNTIFAKYLMDGTSKVPLPIRQKQQLKSFFDNLVCATSTQLLSHCDTFQMVFDDWVKVARFNVANCKVFVKLGFLLGLMLGILLV